MFTKNDDDSETSAENTHNQSISFQKEKFCVGWHLVLIWKYRLVCWKATNSFNMFVLVLFSIVSWENSIHVLNFTKKYNV